MDRDREIRRQNRRNPARPTSAESTQMRALAILRGDASEKGWRCPNCDMTFDWDTQPLYHISFEESYNA